MNTLLAAGLFDQPWLVAVIVIIGALANWLSKRRQEKEADHRPESEPPQPDKPKGEFNLEEALRRLLGEEAPPKQPVPPPIIPRAAPAGPSSKADWQAEEYVQPERNWMEEIREGRAEGRETMGQTPPLFPSTPVAQARAEVTIISPSGEQAQAARRFAQLNEQGRRPATVVHGGNRRLRAGTRAAYWRGSRNARQAFVASLVFGPPKSLET
jgi:hypothetical protein